MQPLPLEEIRNRFYGRTKTPPQPGTVAWAKKRWRLYCTTSNGQWLNHGEMCERILWPEDYQ